MTSDVQLRLEANNVKSWLPDDLHGGAFDAGGWVAEVYVDGDPRGTTDPTDPRLADDDAVRSLLGVAAGSTVTRSCELPLLDPHPDDALEALERHAGWLTDAQARHLAGLLPRPLLTLVEVAP